jgi:IclR family transcriptional regulator, pca regulon regulatory protein
MAAKRESDEQRGRTPVASLGKGLLVLETLASTDSKGSLADLMNRTGFDRATVHRILRSFMDTGYVERSGRGEYAVSTKGYLLGVHLTHAHNLVRVAQPEIRHLRDQINETVNLAVLTGPDIVYLVRLAVGRILSLNIEVGSRLPAFCASLGRAMLAFLPESESEAILRRSDRQAFTPQTKTSIEDIAAILKQIRRRGYAVTNQEFEIGLCSMACPIFVRGGRPIAAVNIAVSAARMSATELVRSYREPLQRSCERISRSLGWDGSSLLTDDPIPQSARATRSSKAGGAL